MNRIYFLLWLFPLSLLGQVLHSKLNGAASCHLDYQISMIENSCFDFFFCGSTLKRKWKLKSKFFIWKCYYQNPVIFIFIGWYIKLTSALQHFLSQSRHHFIGRPLSSEKSLSKNVKNPLIFSSLSFPPMQRSIDYQEINVDVGSDYPKTMSWVFFWRGIRNTYFNTLFSDPR